MYNDERIVINAKNFIIEEIYEQYRRGKIIFYEKSNISQVRKNKIIKEVLDALSRGIPFPPVYVSELQTGQLLVLNKSDRLRFLMEFIDHGFNFRNEEEYRELSDKYEKYYNRREIFYSQILFYVIDYMNPRYMHMQVGAFVEDWTITQEQSIRNVLYRELQDSAFKEVLYEMKYRRNIDLTIEYQFLYFIMIHLVTIDAFRNDEHIEFGNADRFELLESTMYKLNRVNYGYLSDLKDRFESCYYFVNGMGTENMRVSSFAREYRTNYICFLDAWRLIVGKDDLEIFYNKKIKQMIQNCDMSYESIKQIIECFKRGRI